MHDYSKLRVWQAAMKLVTDTYRVTRSWPKREHYGLTSQIRRAAVSVAANIAEGAGRGTPADFARFVRNAVGSASEFETLVQVADHLGYLAKDVGTTLRGDGVSIRRQLRRLEHSLTGIDYLRTDDSGPGY